MRKSGIARAFTLMTLVASVAQAQSSPRVYSPQFDNDRSSDDVPNVQVWLDEATYGYGDLIRPYVQADPEAYLTVVRVSSDGQLHVLYPRLPGQQVRYQPSHFANDRLPVSTASQFLVRESRGVGFVFAVASNYKFNYRYYTNGNNWSANRLASAGRFGSPFQIVRSFVEEITEGSDSYSMDYVMYEVNGDQYRSRYASRFRGYGYNDYYDMCLGAFGNWYSNYCRGYSGYGYPYIVVSTPNSPNPTPGGRSRRVKPLVHDPVIPHPRERPAEGVQPRPDPQEQAAINRRERMLRDGGRRTEPQVYRPAEPRASEPRMQPRFEQPRPGPRSEPRVAPPPQREPMRAAPVIRSEPRMERPRMEAPAPRIERSEPAPKKDN